MLEVPESTTIKPKRFSLPSWLRQMLFFFLKLLIAAIIIIWLVQQGKFDWAALRELRYTPFTTAIMGSAILCVCGSLLLSGWRFYLLLCAAQLHLPMQRAITLTFIGAFYGILLPGMIGGDAVKAVYLCGDIRERRPQALTAILTDRIIGMYALFLLATLALPFMGLLRIFIPRLLLTLLPLFMLLLTCCLALPALLPEKRFQQIIHVLPVPFRTFFCTLRLYLRSTRLVLNTLLLSLFSNGLVVLFFWQIGLLLQDHLSLWQHLLLDPLALSLNAVPLTPGGIGMAEGAFAMLFEQAGSHLGAMLAIIGRIVQYLVILCLGGITVLFYKRKPVIVPE